MAQIIVAVQMVLEEKFVYKHNVHPLKAVGTEGKVFNMVTYKANDSCGPSILTLCINNVVIMIGIYLMSHTTV